MLIVIDVEKFYDWAPMDRQPTEDEIKNLLVKPADNGKWLEKVVVTMDTHTQIGIPEQQIAELTEHWARKGVSMSRAKVVARYLEETVMPHHAHPDHFKKINVHAEPEVEAFLNVYFEVEAT